MVTSEAESAPESPSDGRLMLVDGTAIIYRAYFKLIGVCVCVKIKSIFLSKILY